MKRDQSLLWQNIQKDVSDPASKCIHRKNNVMTLPHVLARKIMTL